MNYKSAFSGVEIDNAVRSVETGSLLSTANAYTDSAVQDTLSEAQSYIDSAIYSSWEGLY